MNIIHYSECLCGRTPRFAAMKSIQHGDERSGRRSESAAPMKDRPGRSISKSFNRHDFNENFSDFYLSFTSMFLFCKSGR
jgi:hypothetical protein